MADEIAGWENETYHMAVSEEEVECVATSLHHAHIPKLADADIVEYDPEQNIVSLTNRFQQIHIEIPHITRDLAELPRLTDHYHSESRHRTYDPKFESMAIGGYNAI